jgi:hypothetical protein
VKKRKSLDPAVLAKMMRRPQDRAAMGALLIEMFETLEAFLKVLNEVMAARFKEWGDPPVVQRRRRAAVIRGEHWARVDKLRRHGVRNPITQAWKELAERHGFDSGYALKRWVRRI